MPERDAEPVSQDAFDEALIREHQAGRLALYHIVPAAYGVWTDDTAQPTELSHVHLLGGTVLSYPMVFEPQGHRVDVLLSCPTLARSLVTASLTSIATVLYLN